MSEEGPDEWNARLERERHRAGGILAEAITTFVLGTDIYVPAPLAMVALAAELQNFLIAVGEAAQAISRLKSRTDFDRFLERTGPELRRFEAGRPETAALVHRIFASVWLTLEHPDNRPS